MELITKVMPTSYTLIDTGDWHLGHINAHMSGIQEVIDRVKGTDDCYLVLKGDLLDSILPNDKRYASCSVSIPTPMQSLDLLTEILTPVKDNILAVLLGNHEYKLINTMNCAAELAKRLDAPYGGYNCKVIMKDAKNNLMHKMFFTHGAGFLASNAKDPIQRNANHMAGLKRKLEATGHSDCIYMSMGHTHKLFVVEPTVENEIHLVDDGKKVKQKYRVQSKQNAEFIPAESRWFGNSGSMLKTNTAPGIGAISYSEVFMYGPTELGWLEVNVRDGQVSGVTKVIS